MGNEPRLGSKIFYKIGEVSQIAKLPAYVLRFWESEFPFLKPKKSRGNQRLYVRREVETVLEIKRMLYEEGHTLAGVKRYWARRGWSQVNSYDQKSSRRSCEGISKRFSKFWSRIKSNDGPDSSLSSRLHSGRFQGDNAGVGDIE